MTAMERNERTRPWAAHDFIGYRVETIGGTAGVVDEMTRHAAENELVVNVRRWPFSRKVVLPAGAVNCVDKTRRRVWLERDRDAVRNAPVLGTAPGRSTASNSRAVPAQGERYGRPHTVSMPRDGQPTRAAEPVAGGKGRS